MRLACLFVVATMTVSVVTGCGAASAHRNTVQPPGKFPVVVAHPSVRSSGIGGAELQRVREDGAVLLSPSRVAFMTSGTVNCAWWPKRLTVLSPSAIRIDMRVDGRVTACGSGGAVFPIAVKIDPRLIDVHRPVNVRVAYKVRVHGRTTQWNINSVASGVPLN